MPSVQRSGKLPVGYESLGKGKRKIGCFEKKHGIPPEAVRKSKKPKPVRSDMCKSRPQVCPKCKVEIDKTDKPRLRCPRCGQGVGVTARKPRSARSDAMGHKMHYGHYLVKGKVTACGIKEGKAWAGTVTHNPKEVTCIKCKVVMKKKKLGW